MVIYSILTTDSDTQFVRIYSTYSPPGADPSKNPDEHPVTDAQVTIWDGSTAYAFRDTVLRRPDKSRYPSDIRLYSASAFRVESNKKYTLKAFSPTHGSGSATITVPAPGLLNILTTNVLDNPSVEGVTFGKPVTINFRVSDLAKAILIRFYIVFTAENSWESESERYREKYFEVPFKRIAINRLYDKCEIILPQLKVQSGPRPSGPRRQDIYEGFDFPFPTYNESIANIRFFNFNVKFKRAVFRLIQFDDPWYKYYGTVNAFNDRFSVRQDQPDYTNIEGALGVFGSSRVDSIAWTLPERIEPFPSPYALPITICQ